MMHRLLPINFSLICPNRLAVSLRFELLGGSFLPKVMEDLFYVFQEQRASVSRLISWSQCLIERLIENNCVALNHGPISIALVNFINLEFRRFSDG